jgi:hypothetical protein
MKEFTIKDEAKGLHNLLDEKTVTETTWSPNDLEAMLKHQLSVELATDLIPVVPEAEATLSMETTVLAHPPRTFGEALCHPSPPVSLLRLIKEFSKDLRYAPDNGVPDDLLLVLYYAAIVAARVRCRENLTSLDDEAVRQGCSWCLAKPWLTTDIRRLFEEGLADRSA